MRFLHLSDLHLGKRLGEMPLAKDQEYILSELAGIADSENADAVIIAGDVYDTAVPPAEAVSMFDRFITRLADSGKKIFIISGNHDSQRRLEFGASLMKNSGVYLRGTYGGAYEPVVLRDEEGEICVYMLPFVKPSSVRFAHEECEAATTDEAVRFAISAMNVDPSKRNILIAHQFVAGSQRSDSEDLSAGGSDSVGPDALAAFDYVALGHLHSSQRAGSEFIRYCGSPLKYSFSEIRGNKCALIVDVMKKGCVSVKSLPLTPLHDLRHIKGEYAQLTLLENYKGTKLDDYVYITLTDEDDVPNAIGKLRSIYPNILKLDYDNVRTRTTAQFDIPSEVKMKSPEELISEFFKMQNSVLPNEYQTQIIKDTLKKLRDGEDAQPPMPENKEES